MYLRELTILHEKVQHHDTYPFNIRSIQGTDVIEFKNAVTFFVGENGSGKSTLLEAISYKCEFNSAGGGKNDMYSVDASQSDLGNYIRLSWLPKINKGFFLRAESFFNFATYLDKLAKEEPSFSFESYGGKSLHHQSHGESFLSLFKNRFEGKGIYLLDEPEAALSPARQLAFLKIMNDLVSTGEAQFIIATHSPILLGYPEAQILNFDDSSIQEISYEDTEHYNLTLNFLTGRDRFLYELFRDDLEED
ncbi:putative ATPase [Gracilibacillus halotolerans]|uniref:Putative ATPase n=1 Tax=Gracilibacillus halotolerans TaxID=74386 RepID=A0A841RQU7_9BACI|nr:AAA family ATPase [Gracilibacillus halotolerans]MBB6514202.1 putative ATPase [Gracilibacillus halotolerans]